MFIYLIKQGLMASSYSLIMQRLQHITVGAPVTSPKANKGFGD